MAENSSDAVSQVQNRDVELLQVWRSIRRIFTGWRSVFYTLFANWSMRSMARSYGDAITNSLKLPYWQRFEKIIAPLSDADVDFLRVLAQQQFEFVAASFRMNAVIMVTVPVTAAVLFNQIFPGSIVTYFEEQGSSNPIYIVGAFFILAIGLLFAGVYRAREMRMALEIEAAKRRLARGETIASAGGDAQDLSI